MTKFVTFLNGNKMPLLGLGTSKYTSLESMEKAVEEALKAGYRHIDTAFNYYNEQVIGKVLKRWLDDGKVTREELFITTKLPHMGMTVEKVDHFLNKSLANLQLDYVDLYLIHSPVGVKYTSDDNPFSKVDGKHLLDLNTDLEGVWKALETKVDSGKAKSIGVANFTAKQLERIAKIARIPPSNIQVEVTAYFQQKELRATCARLGVTICAYAPLGSPGRATFFPARGLSFEYVGLLTDPVIVEIAKQYSKTPAQILIKFLTQQGIATIPKSVTPERIWQNIDVFDFHISQEDMAKLESLDRGYAGRTFKIQVLPNATEHPEYPYHDVD